MAELEFDCFDRFSGVFYRTTMSKLKECENEVNKKILKNGYCSYNEFIEILSGDWTEEQKIKFNASRTEAWGKCGFANLNGTDHIEFITRKCKDATGFGFVVLEFDARLWNGS